MTNFSKKELKRYILKSIISLFVFCFILLIILNILPIIKIYNSSRSIKNDLYSLKNDLYSATTIKNTLTTANNIKSETRILRDNVNDLKLLNYIPQINDNIIAVDNLSEILLLSMDGYIEIYPILEKNISIINKEKNNEILSIPEEDKVKIINSLYENQASFDNMQKKLDRIIYLTEKNKDKKYIKPVQNIWNEINAQQSNLLLAKRFIPVIKSLPELLGTPKDAKYLLLFQNNTELRPTGGFIGTYGILGISNGEIGDIFTDNIYNLDRASASRVKITPPKPLKDYLKIQYLYLRDANFDPDFENSAKYIIDLYKKESQNQYPITGVIAITPNVLQSVIGYFGEVEAMGLKFNKENSIDLLNYETKFGYWKDKDIPVSQRKIIIQKLSDVLFENIKSLSFGEMKDLFSVISKDLEKKQMLMYFDNADAQKFVKENNWAGKLVDNTNSDYFSVVDTNVLSGKAEPYIDKHIDYTLRQEGVDLVATLSLTYTHRYDDYLKNNIYQDDPGYMQAYKSYTRIYVPEGAWLNSLTLNDGVPSRNNIDFANENGKTSFGFYLVIPKNTTTTYKLEYRLPKELVEKFKTKYSLIYQKQSGLAGNHINININLNKSVKSYSINNNTNLNIKAYSNVFNINGFVDTDRKVDIQYYNSEMSYLKAIINKSYLSLNKQTSLRN